MSGARRGSGRARADGVARPGRAILLGALLAAAVLVPATTAEAEPTPTSAAPPPVLLPPTLDPDAKAAARAEATALAADLDLSQATLDEVDAAIMELDRARQTHEAALRKADRQLAGLRRRLEDLRDSARELDHEVAELRAEVRRQAVEVFVQPPSEDVGESILSGDLLAASQQRFLIGLVDRADADAVDQLDRRQRELRHQRQRVREVTVQVERGQARQRAQLAELHQATVAQEALAASIRATIAQQLRRSVELAALDRSLAGEIAARQAALQARLLGPGAPANGTPADVQAAGGGELGPLPVDPAQDLDALGLSLCTVEGITVNCLVGFDVALMVRAARADGVVLVGSGYRSAAQQIALRRAHCGDSYEAVFLVSASACHPATARPGTSLHEVGLAVDFSSARSRSSPAYAWLAAHAASYGFYNLPEEPWHWSVTGG